MKNRLLVSLLLYFGGFFMSFGPGIVAVFAGFVLTLTAIAQWRGFGEQR